MFGKQRRKAVLDYAYKSALQEAKFGDAIRKADDIKDPAEKVLALRKIVDDVTAQIEREGGVIDRTSIRESNKVTLSGMGGTAVVATATTFLVATPIGWVGLPVFVGGLAVTGIVSKLRKNSVQKDLEEASKEHIQRMAKQINAVSSKIDAVVNDNVEEISKSPLYGKIHAIPDLATRFAGVAAKKLAEPKPEVAPEQAAAPEAKKEEPKKVVRKEIDPRHWSKSLDK